MSDKITSVRSLIMALAAILFASTLFDAIYGFKNFGKGKILDKNINADMNEGDDE